MTHFTEGGFYIVRSDYEGVEAYFTFKSRWAKDKSRAFSYPSVGDALTDFNRLNVGENYERLTITEIFEGKEFSSHHKF